MHIKADVKDFVPKRLVIVNFNGKDTCFAWNNEQFVAFPYIYKDATIALKVLTAPTKIKNIRGINRKTFVLCVPNGIYELTEDFEFLTLSKTGLELITEFCVLTLNNGMLILDDKKSENALKLISLSTVDSIYVLSVNYSNTDNSFYKALLLEEHKSDANLYLIAVNKKLFKLVNQTFQIIYEYDHTIKSIVTFEKQKEVFGALLQTNSNTVILIHVVENKVIYNKIFIGTSIKTICPVISDNKQNSVLLAYSDGTKTYYSSVLLTTNLIREIKAENKNYSSIISYQSKFIIYLDDFSNLFQVSTCEMNNLCEENTFDYVGLQSNMLRGLENIIDVICQKTQELKILREEMLHKEDCLKRINMFVNKQTLKYCPKDSVLRLLNHLFLICNFKKSLFDNSTVAKVLKSRGKTIYLLKDVHDYDTIVEMPIYLSNLSSKLYTTTDLITYKSNDGIWCLIRNYVQDPLPNKTNRSILSSDKLNTVKYNLVVLQNLMKENKLSMEHLSKLKKNIRKIVEL